MRKALSLPLIALVAAHAPALAQSTSSTEPEVPQAVVIPGEIVVLGNLYKGQVEAPQAPIVTLDESEIASYGANSLGDLVTALSPQTGSARGRGGGFPVMLINGQRVSSFREMRNFPPEAIRRVEVLPEEVALRYGYSANQRVINFILKDNYASKAMEFEFRIPDRGGADNEKLEADLLKITGPNRINLHLEGERTSMLKEADRGVIQTIVPTVPTDPNPANNRSLISASRNLTGNLTWTKGLGQGGKGGSIALNASATHSESDGLSGLNTVSLPGSVVRTYPGALIRNRRSDSVQAGASLNAMLGRWRLSATVDASHAITTNFIQQRVLNLTAAATGPLPAFTPGAIDRARQVSDTATTLITLSGKPLALPAGEVSATVKAGFAYTGLNSSDTRALGSATRLKRGDASAGINLALPLTSRKREVLGAIGDLTLNLSGAVNRLSDFGTLKDWSAGLVWGPSDRLSLSATYFYAEEAPSLSDLGAPQTQAQNVPIFDYRNNQTVLATVTSGGNPGLLRQTQRDLKVAGNWQVPFIKDASLSVEYFRNNARNVAEQFLQTTPAFEAAFPGRITRSATTGLVTAVDQRPVSFLKETADRIKYGLNISGTIGKAAPGGGMGGMRGGRPGGPPGAGRGGPGPMMGMMGGGGQGRWNLSIYHTIRLSQLAQVAAAGPTLDLLNGDALASNGGVARHLVEMEGGGFYHGLGMRLNGSYAAATRVNNLRFGSLFKLDLRFFLDFNLKPKLVKSMPFLKGARMGLIANNVLDQRQKVTDAKGQVPLAYQADYLDPRGRVIGFEFRKMF